MCSSIPIASTWVATPTRTWRSGAVVRISASECTSPRIEIAALLRELLTRCPDLAPAGEPERMASSFIAGVRHMPVTFTPARP